MGDAIEAGSTQAPADKTPDADEFNKVVSAATGLIRAGFDPQESLLSVGLPPVLHTGMEPVTVRDPRVSEAEAEVAEAEAEEVSSEAMSGDPPEEGEQ